MFKLVISDDEGKTTVVPLVRDEITVGRKEGNTIRLTERNVSRRHARLRRTSETFHVEDLGSYNGVKVNGERIEGEAVLRSGDKIGIGDYELLLQAEGAEATDELRSEESVSIPMADLAEPVPPARLVMLTAPAPGAEYALVGETVRIGRSEDLDVWVNHRSISREHASFHRSAESVVVRDLDSANGVRLNGAEISEAELQSGDILELGQVRFRFVDEGETYVYDAEDAQAAGIAPEGKARRGAPMLAAVAIILVAVGAGAMIAVSGGNGTPNAHEPDPSEENEQVVEAVEPRREALARAAEAARGCETAVAAGRYDDALRFAAEALSAHPDSEAAAICRVAAQEGLEEQAIFDRGNEALSEGDVDAAYFAFEELPVGSTLREHESVVGARAMFIERRLQLARRALPREPVEAVRQANVVLSVDGVGETEQREAETLIARARRRGVAVDAPNLTPPTRSMMRPPSTMAPDRPEPSTPEPRDLPAATSEPEPSMQDPQPRTPRGARAPAKRRAHLWGEGADDQPPPPSGMMDPGDIDETGPID